MQLDRIDGEARPVAPAKSQDRTFLIVFCPPEFACPGRGEFGLRGSSRHNRKRAA